jgi:DNA polymerase I
VGVDELAVQLDMFAPEEISGEPHSGAPTQPRLVRCEQDCAELLRALESAQRIAFDTETTGTDVTRCELVGMSFCTQAGTGWYVPVALTAATDGDIWHLRPDSSQARDIRDILNRTPAGLAAHNAKFDLAVLKRHHLLIDRTIYDTMLAQFAIDPFARGALGLKRLAKDYLGWDMQEIETLIGRSKHQRSMRDVPLDLVAPYAAADADATYQLVDKLQPQVKALQLESLLDEVEFPLIPVLVDMELAGVAIDLPYLSALSHEMTTRLHQLEAEIYQLAGRAFNIGSPQQLGAVLYGMLGLHVDVSGGDDRQPSTRAHRLEALRDKHPIVAPVLQHRELAKLLGTYVDALPALVNPATGRLHTHFNQAVVVTGRLSSTNPNLQNVPITSEMGRHVRRAFIAAPGACVMSSDYSQIELRVLAHLANDTALRAAFLRGEDIHRSTAAAVCHVPLENVTPEQRAFAKHINFGIAYGMSSFSLARSTGMTDAQAEKFMADYFRRYSGVRHWIEDTKHQIMREHYVATLFGRRRPFNDMRGRTNSEVRRAERLGVNHPVQGTAAEIIKVAMIKLHRAMTAGGYKAKLTLQVHDELVLDVPREEVADIRELVRREMEGALPLSVPLKADVEAGDNWDSVK